MSSVEARTTSIWIDAPGVSRHHAWIVINGDEATIEDLGSKNGGTSPASG